jgi:X-X-X-Leu-X-X-Gly heptad repeat protein
MKKRSNKRVALLIPFALLASFAFAGLPGSASAQSNTANKVVDYETLTGSLNSDGSISRLRLLDDLRVTGTGDVVVVDPNSTTGLRNLMGYSGPEAAGSNQVKYTINNLDGTKQYVTVSDPVGKQPPVAMSIAYTLNGQSVASGSDLVGKTGDIGIAFTVKNTTSKTMNVTYKDTQGNTLTSPQQVPLPLVAQLQVTLPPNIFTQLNAAGADIFTDAFGNKIVNWALVLVPPVGDVTQTVTLLAHADGFALGPVQLAAAPVAPQSRNYLDFAENQFANGIEQSGSLYTGTTQIADNLDTLHTGTLKLVGGIEKLYKGAQKLATGLNSAIAPAGTLMAGIGKLQTGL